MLSDEGWSRVLVAHQTDPCFYVGIESETISPPWIFVILRGMLFSFQQYDKAETEFSSSSYPDLSVAIKFGKSLFDITTLFTQRPTC